MKKNICFWSKMLILIAVGLFTLGMIFCESRAIKSTHANPVQQDHKTEGQTPQCDKKKCIPPKRDMKKKRKKDSTIQGRINRQQGEIKRRIDRLDKKLMSRKSK
jgi:hypothetical protein